MATIEQVADWLIANQGKKGSPEFTVMADAYRSMRGDVPQQPPSTKRSFTETFLSDPAAALVQGVGAVAQMPGQAVTLLGGTDLGATMQKPGEAIAEFGKEMQSEGLKAQNALRDQRIAEAAQKGTMAELITTIKEYVTPTQLPLFIIEQLPQLIGPLGAGKVVKALGYGGSALPAAIGAGATMQGVDIGHQTYEETLDILRRTRQDLTEEQRQQIALEKGRAATVEAGAISVGANLLPGGAAIEKRLVGLPGAGRMRSGAGELLSEALEEGGGQVASNVNVRDVDPSIALMRGVGQAAGLGAIGGGTLGTLLGAQSAPQSTPAQTPQTPPGQTPTPPTPPAPQQAAVQAAAQVLQQGGNTQQAMQAAMQAVPPQPGQTPRDVQVAAQQAVQQAVQTAQSAAAAPAGPSLTPPVEGQTTPPANTSVPEPKVKKSRDEGPLGGQIYDHDLQKFGNLGIRARIVGKDAADPDVRIMVEGAIAEGKKTRKNGKPVFTAGTIKTLEDFLARLPQPITPTTTEAPNAPAIGPTGTAAAPAVANAPQQPSEPAAGVGGVGNEVASEPPARTPTPTPGTPDATGVVPTAQPIGELDGGKGAVPATVMYEGQEWAVQDLGNNVRLTSPKGMRLMPKSGRVWKGIIGEQTTQVSPAPEGAEATAGTVQPPAEEITKPAEGGQTTEVAEVTPDALMDQVKALEAEQKALLTKAGRVPAVKSPARKKFDALAEQIDGLKAKWADMTRKPAPSKESLQPQESAPVVKSEPDSRTTEGTAFATDYKPETGTTVSDIAPFGETLVEARKGLRGEIKDLTRQLSDVFDPKQKKTYEDYIAKLQNRLNNIERQLKRRKVKLEPAKEVNAEIEEGVQEKEEEITAEEMKRLQARSKENKFSYDQEIHAIDQAVGAYNNPEPDKPREANRRRIQRAADYIFETATAPAFGPNEKAVKKHALKALAQHIDPIDLTSHHRPLYDEVTKDIAKPSKAEREYWNDLLYLKDGNLKPQPSDDAIGKMIEGGTSIKKILNYISKNSANPDVRVIARFMLRLPVDAKIAFRERPDYAPKGVGMFDWQTNEIQVFSRIRLERIILHEYVHAATHYAVQAETPQAQKLQKLFDEFKKNSNNSESYGFNNLDEFLAEALSNVNFQMELEILQEGIWWSKFKEVIRQILGLPQKYDTALQFIMQAMPTLAAENAQIREEYKHLKTKETGQTPFLLTAADEATLQGFGQIDTKRGRSWVTDVKAKLGSDKLNSLRVQIADSFAGVEKVLNDLWNKQVRTLSGELNPSIQLSQARDAPRISKAGQGEGIVGLDENVGIFEAQEYIAPEQFNLIAGEAISYKNDVLKYIADQEKAQRKPEGSLRKLYGEAIAAHRVHELRQIYPTFTSNLTPQQIVDGERIYQNTPEIQRIVQVMDALRHKMIDLMVQTGRITEEKATAWKEASGYVPFDRLGEFDEKIPAGGTNRGMAALRNMPHLEGGSTEPIANPIDSYSGLYDWMTNEAMRNYAALHAADAMALAGVIDSVQNPAAYSGRKGGVFSLYRNGIKVHFYARDPALLPAFSQKDQQLSSGMRAMQSVSKVLRAGVTATPVFAWKQIFDDIARIYVHSGVKNPHTVMWSALRNMPRLWLAEVLGEKHPMVRSLEKLGIVGTFDFTQESNLKNILHEAGAEKRGLGANIMRVLEAGAKASDLSVREAIYNQTLRETGDKAAAESAAREIINFSRRGAARGMSYLVSGIPFFNAYVQGMDKLYTAITKGKLGGSTLGQAQSVFYKRMAVLTTIGALYALLMQDDEEYQKLDDHVRDRNWVLPWGKDLGYTPVIPVANELAYFFKVIPERLVRYYKYHGTSEEQTAINMVSELLRAGGDIFATPNLLAQGVRPIIENMANYSFLLGRPLESQQQQNYDPWQRYGSTTSPTLKDVSRGLHDVGIGISPIKLENFVRGFFGTLGGISLAFTDAMLHPEQTDRPLHKHWASQASGFAAFMRDGIGSRYINEIYDLEKRTTQVENTARKLERDDPTKLADYIEKNMGAYVMSDTVQSIMKDIRGMNRMALELDKMTEMSPSFRRDTMNLLKEREQEIARSVYLLRKKIADIDAGRELPPDWVVLPATEIETAEQ